MKVPIPQSIEISRCPKHGFYAISIGTEEWGQRITPSKCCGRWVSVKKWELSKYDWEYLAKSALAAAKCAKGA
jgi:hypothetical protein